MKTAYKRSMLPGFDYRLQQTSVKESAAAKLEPKSNGFVYAVLDAYANHHHLRIRYVVVLTCGPGLLIELPYV